MSPDLRHRNLPMLLLQAREAVMAQFRPILNAHGVTEQQWRVLRALWQSEASEPLEPRQLSDACQIVGPSLAGVLKRMEETGWVQRAKMASDQRRVRVSPQVTSKRSCPASTISPHVVESAMAVTCPPRKAISASAAPL